MYLINNNFFNDLSWIPSYDAYKAIKITSDWYKILI